jgi:DNA repair protein RadC
MLTKRQRLNQLKGNWTASEISISYKAAVLHDIPITSQEKAYTFILSLWNKELINLQEQKAGFFFNSRSQNIGYRVLSTGTMDSTVIDIRLLAGLALHSLASFVIIAHNHPSGILQASINDIYTTRKIKKALRLIDVKLMDHLIISESGWLSMSVEGLL